MQAGHLSAQSFLLRGVLRLAVLALALNFSAIGPAFAQWAGHASVDLCGDGCETGPLNRCPPACLSCTASRAVPPVLHAVPAPICIELPAVLAVSQLLRPPPRLDAEGVFHPPKAAARA